MFFSFQHKEYDLEEEIDLIWIMILIGEIGSVSFDS